MAVGDGSFRSRAASLLPHVHGSIRRSLHRDSNSEKPSSSPKSQQTDPIFNEKTPSPGLEKTLTNSSSAGGTHHTSGSNAAAHNREAQRVVRTIPTWVQTLDENDEDLLPPKEHPRPPNYVHFAHHNTTPVALFRSSGPAPGRLHDHERQWTPPLPRGTVIETESRWRPFIVSSTYPTVSEDVRGEVVTEAWLKQNGADYSRPWLAGLEDGDAEKGNASMFRSHLRRRAWYEKFARTILRSPIVPMVIRMIVFGFSLIALALACSLHELTRLNHKVHSTPSTNMAIVVDAVAMVYLLYITYDEYSGKPLGLRPATAKLRLIFLDLFFIVFDSANLSLAFESLEDRGTCGEGCDRQRALASVLLIALIAWLMTFSISVLRVIERVHT